MTTAAWATKSCSAENATARAMCLSDDAIADFYELAVDRLARMGLHRYEISNFARPGFESRHNLKYWRREPYLGFGADAHSFDGTWRWSNAESAADYVAGTPTQNRTMADAIGERFYLGLRLSEGIEGEWSPFEEPIEKFLSEGLLEFKDGRLRLTSSGGDVVERGLRRVRPCSGVIIPIQS